ncbi:Gamma-glutamyl phosphate reductase [Wickerhamiella sorbophila]|uniref:glutamate-5-semialdehyde dehydrogenase n=1 Tax=Wickerhamiella sorbophila TaxID=45607 RepID=A0A2T0FE00_9ASCO|nr:Gamma-glutamyl phosphate reductase [Wickerhamiella sorbophila]PRT53238.1 Gamma-glutamyl phosphate reductase [Wickerhamiella sorbophila]
MEIAKAARKAANTLKTLSNDKRTSALKAIHDHLRDHKDIILESNRLDLQLAEQADLSPALIKRLDLNKGDKFDVMLQGVLDVAALEDPVGRQSILRELDDGLVLERVASPVGVLLVIFEARPEVIANIGALAIKSGNAAILKGGKESSHTFQSMAEVIRTALAKTSVPTDSLQLIATREKVADLLHCDKYIDMVIPRGSNELVRSIKRSTTIPVLGHADGICSIYANKDATAEMAAEIIVDSKTNYPAGCNAVETVLIHQDTQFDVLRSILVALLDAGVTVKLEHNLYTRAREALPDEPKIVEAAEEDFDTEFLALTVAVKYVESLQEAIDHINEHGSHHTDCIITENALDAAAFQKGVDSAGVFWNASTRFADGYRYGFGTEVGISTNKLHARGPVGLEGLMSYQYLLKGKGHIAGNYVGAGGNRHFTHKDL